MKIKDTLTMSFTGAASMFVPSARCSNGTSSIIGSSGWEVVLSWSRREVMFISAPSFTSSTVRLRGSSWPAKWVQFIWCYVKVIFNWTGLELVYVPFSFYQNRAIYPRMITQRYMLINESPRTSVYLQICTAFGVIFFFRFFFWKFSFNPKDNWLLLSTLPFNWGIASLRAREKTLNMIVVEIRIPLVREKSSHRSMISLSLSLVFW